MNERLLHAVLAMDAYNRGYNAAIDLLIKDKNGNTLSVGNAKIKFDSTESLGDGVDSAIGFYAIAYEYNGKTIISYRGTNTTPDEDFDNDRYHGWSLGAGNVNSEQAHMAIRFYQAVAGAGNWLSASISLTGHSLGGGPAGPVGANDNTFSEERNAA